LLDLLKAYFADSRLPVDCKELRRPASVLLAFDPREGHVRVANVAESPVRSL
jgi:hypothetical protein